MRRTLYVGDYQRSSWSLRAWLALHVGRVPVDTVSIRLDRPETAAALRAISPTGKVPALQVGGVTIWESLAICEYAAEESGTLWPEDPLDRAVARAIASEMHAGFPNTRREHPMDLLARRPTPPSAAVVPELARLDEVVATARARAGTGAFLFGAFSVADAMLAPMYTRVVTYDLPVAAATREWGDEILAHPAMREWERRARLEAEEDAAA
jgi:glutathione S-transferase